MRKPFFHCFLRWVSYAERSILSCGILFIAGITIANVICRTIFHQSLAFAEELSQFSMILVTFVGLSYAARSARHIRMSALYDQLGRRPRKVLALLISGATAILMFLLCYYALHYTAAVRSSGTVSPALRVPLFLVYYAVPIGFALAGIEYLFTFGRNLSEKAVYLSYERTDGYENVQRPRHRTSLRGG